MKRLNSRPAVLNIIWPDSPRSCPEWFSTLQNPLFDLKISRTPLPPVYTDIYLVHIKHFPHCWKSGIAAGPPVIAWGIPELLGAAFELGCSDYLKEPWGLEELRIRCCRVLPGFRISLSWGTVHLRNMEMQCGSKSVELNPSEYKIIRLLCRYQQQPVQRETFQYALWGQLRPGSRAVDVHISSLRNKFCFLAENRLNPGPIRTVHGTGYILAGNFLP